MSYIKRGAIYLWEKLRFQRRSRHQQRYSDVELWYSSSGFIFSRSLCFHEFSPSPSSFSAFPCSWSRIFLYSLITDTQSSYGSCFPHCILYLQIQDMFTLIPKTRIKLWLVITSIGHQQTLTYPRYDLVRYLSDWLTRFVFINGTYFAVSLRKYIYY